MSQLKVNSIIPVAGVASGQGGGVIQTITSHKNDSFSTDSLSFIDITGFSVSITPTLTSSKILIMTCCTMQQSNQNGIIAMNLVRGSTAIAQPSNIDTNGSSYTSHFGAVTSGVFPWAHHFIDSPSTTSQVTYKWQTKTTSHGIFFNIRNNSDLKGTSSMTVMEISA